MVKSVSSLTRNGLRDWVIQNFSAFFMATYLIGLVGYSFFVPLSDFYNWQQLFSTGWVRIATLLFVVLLTIHTRIGLWTIATDYLKNFYVRAAFLIITSLILITCLIWSVQILWSI